MRYNVEIYATLLGRTGKGEQLLQVAKWDKKFSAVYVISASTSWSPPEKAGVYKYHLPGILFQNLDIGTS